MAEERERSISIERLEDWTTDCDGCGREIPIGALALMGIDSCCGQCSRTLCAECVCAAYEQLQQQEPPS